MKVADVPMLAYVDTCLKLPPGKRREYLEQADRLIDRFTAKIDKNSSFSVKGFRKAGSMAKGTILKPRDGESPDIDIAVYVDVSEAAKEEVELINTILFDLLVLVYPQKDPKDFDLQPHTLGGRFIESGLLFDLVPVIPIDDEPGFGWQPSSNGGAQVKTNIKAQLDFIRARHQADITFRPLVRLLKQWRNRQKGDVAEMAVLKSFTIELIAAHLQDLMGLPTSLEEGVIRTLEYIGVRSGLRAPISFPEHGMVSQFPGDPVVILDPVNASNNVASRISETERIAIVDSARTAWETVVWARNNDFKGETVGLWRELFGPSFNLDY
jgi:predicted nucleotidyltransferase